MAGTTRLETAKRVDPIVMNKRCQTPSREGTLIPSPWRQLVALAEELPGQKLAGLKGRSF